MAVIRLVMRLLRLCRLGVVLWIVRAALACLFPMQQWAQGEMDRFEAEG
jgi:hypothetical protein